MLDAARNENWDGMMRLEGTCMVLIAQLRFQARSSSLQANERMEKNRIMQKILRTDAEIRLLAEPWIQDIDRILGLSEHTYADSLVSKPVSSGTTLH